MMKMKENCYVPVSDVIFRRNHDGMLLKCARPMQDEEILRKMHE